MPSKLAFHLVPRGRTQILCAVYVCGCRWPEPRGRIADYLLGVRVQVGTPPAEAAVGNNVVAAAGH